MKFILNGRALYTEKDKIWVAKGMTFFAIDYNGNRITQKYSVGSFKQKLLSCNRAIGQLFREGIHHLVPLKNGDIFLTCKRKAYVVGKNGEIKSTFSGFVGNKPGHQGVCVTPNGDIFFGEYSVNLDHKNQSSLYRSVDNGLTFEKILTFDRTVRHIHFIKFDPYENALWLGTGDEDKECHLLKSVDNGNTFETVGTGSQDWRAIGVCFTKDYLIWGTDAGSVKDQNHIIQMNRQTKKLEILGDAEGPCHGCASFINGKVFISTGVEGGENEKDRFSRLKEIKDGKIIDLLKIKKNILPLIVQYGVMRFPLGTENTDKIVFTTMGLKRNLEKVYVYEQEN